MQRIIDNDGQLSLDRAFLAADEAQTLFECFMDTLSWQTETYTLYGKPVNAPRLVCWYGDAQAVYRYSGIDHVPIPWTPDLLTVKGKIEETTGKRFNSVLGNLYRSGQDSIGWHADREKELGSQPFIASLSLGATRLFRIRHNRSHETLELKLSAGSLLCMGGDFQRNWKHCVPKTSENVGVRINLTFRYIFTGPDSV